MKEKNGYPSILHLTAHKREEKKKRQTRTRSVRTRRCSTDESQLSELVYKRSLCSSLFFFCCCFSPFHFLSPLLQILSSWFDARARRLSFFFLSIENYKLKKGNGRTTKNKYYNRAHRSINTHFSIYKNWKWSAVTQLIASANGDAVTCNWKIRKWLEATTTQKINTHTHPLR